MSFDKCMCSIIHIPTKVSNIFIIPQISPSQSIILFPTQLQFFFIFFNYILVLCVLQLRTMCIPFLLGFFCSAYFLWDSYVLCGSIVLFFFFNWGVSCYMYISTICTSIFLLMDIWDVSRFLLLWIKLLWIFLYKSLRVHIFWLPWV